MSINKQLEGIIFSFTYLFSHCLQVGCEKSFVLLLLLFGQISEALDFSTAILILAQTNGEIFHFVVSHGVIISQFFPCLDVPEGFVDPVGSIEADTAVRIAGMVHRPPHKAEEDPLIHSNLTGVGAIWAVILLHLTGIDQVSSFQVLGSVKPLAFFA